MEKIVKTIFEFTALSLIGLGFIRILWDFLKAISF